jgi:hypothetical protein
MGLPIA